MTDHDARLARVARLEDATKGDTVTIPDGWEKPDDPEQSARASRADLRPGDVFTNDGSDVMEWALGKPARHRDGNAIWYGSRTLARLGLEPDRTRTPDVDAGPRVSVSDAVPEGTAILGDFSQEPETTTRGEKARAARDADADDAPQGEDGESTSIGSVTVTVTPDTAAFEARLDTLSVQADELAARIATLPETYELDEYQRERVAALEQALRVLESRRPGRGAEAGSLAAMFGKRADVPLVGKRDLVDVAAFIANGDVVFPEVKA